ncbi:hypothetical protein [Calidifontibacillus erzurumensis]|uniref:hypothetical protein n=1 Tax=Calidifontibacillus erzurumensis TaxID=2741433 RepID=UPI0035B56656
MKQNLWTIYCCILFLIVPMIVPTYAFANGIKGDQFEDENSPISFKIELLPWDQVDEILPKFSVFTIIDVETGLSFKVQRRAGNHHADVQPLSFKDTKVMKKIYNNKWSWNRRAILILKDDQIIAASMHGMPHGAGALRNGFPGHFCVHFWESTTHKRDKMDLAHQMMILKAAGKFDDYLEKTDPLALINIFAVAVNNHDHFLLKETIAKNTYQSKLRKKMIKDISYISLIKVPNLTNKAFQDLLAIEIPVKVEFHSKKKGKTKKVIPFLIRRDSLIDRWYIEGQTLLKEFS